MLGNDINIFSFFRTALLSQQEGQVVFLRELGDIRIKIQVSELPSALEENKHAVGGMARVGESQLIFAIMLKGLSGARYNVGSVLFGPSGGRKAQNCTRHRECQEPTC
jgi:hypothetical protein